LFFHHSWWLEDLDEVLNLCHETLETLYLSVSRRADPVALRFRLPELEMIMLNSYHPITMLPFVQCLLFYASKSCNICSLSKNQFQSRGGISRGILGPIFLIFANTKTGWSIVLKAGICINLIRKCLRNMPPSLWLNRARPKEASSP
jgi:hypothetical protein